MKAYATERLSLSVKWDINQILDMKGTPQRPDPTKPGLSIPVKIRLEPDVSIDNHEAGKEGRGAQSRVPQQGRLQKLWFH